jgi:O-antigen/teichoic acid export membrane protein
MSWIFTGNLFHALCQWGVLVALAKLGSAEYLGEFALGLAIATPVFMFTDLNLRAFQATDARGQFEFSDYWVVRLLGVTVSLVAIGGALLVGGWSRESALVIFVVALGKACESLSDITYGLFQKHERMGAIALSLALRGAFSTLALISVLWLTGSLLAAVGAMTIARLLVLMGRDLWVSHRLESLHLAWSPPTIRRVVRSALPLGIVMMLVSLNASLPLYWIRHELGTVQVAYFAALLYFLSVGRVVIDAITQPASPRLARHLQEGRGDAFRSLQFRMVGFGLAVGAACVLGALLLGEPLLAFFYAPEYGRHAGTLAWIMAAGMFSFGATFLGSGMTAARRFRQMLFLNVLTISVTAGLLFALVSRFGLNGAAWALLASSALKFGLSLIINRDFGSRSLV